MHGTSHVSRVCNVTYIIIIFVYRVFTIICLEQTMSLGYIKLHILLLLLLLFFIQDVHHYVPGTNHVSRVYKVTYIIIIFLYKCSPLYAWNKPYL